MAIAHSTFFGGRTTRGGRSCRLCFRPPSVLGDTPHAFRLAGSHTRRARSSLRQSPINTHRLLKEQLQLRNQWPAVLTRQQLYLVVEIILDTNRLGHSPQCTTFVVLLPHLWRTCCQACSAPVSQEMGNPLYIQAAGSGNRFFTTNMALGLAPAGDPPGSTVGSFAGFVTLPNHSRG